MNVEFTDNSKEVLEAMQKAAVRALEECGLTTEGYAKKLCPVDTGNLRNSITHSVDESAQAAYIGTNSEYAPYDRACVHAFIDANTGVVYQCLPWNFRAWHAGGTANNTHIGVEMCEPSAIKYQGVSAKFDVTDREKALAQCETAYNAAVDLFAFLCDKYALDPLKDGVIISHNEAGKRGLGSGHVDPEHLWDGLGTGFTMDGFRRDVKAAIP